MFRFLPLLFIFLSYEAISQSITGEELLEKAIQYHDPEARWSDLGFKLYLELTRPGRPSRNSEVLVRNSDNYFKLVEKTEGNEIVREVTDEKGTATYNGSSDFSQEISDKYRLTNDRILRTRNYYVYLYGLPMKLRDPGTNIREEVKEVSFNGKNYLELGVTYDDEVGSDDWFFYIDPDTYAMEGYKFYHENGKGEYITLEKESNVGGVKMPAIRNWYITQDSTFLGADNLSKFELLD